jgi:beta-lactamase superfamily II metal-dependent hydrolase
MILEIVFWDVQHGNATYIKTANGTHIVQDLGTGSYGTDDRIFSPLFYLKNSLGIDHLDCVIITHPHKDHIDDIMNFDRLSPRVLIRPSHIPVENIMKDVREGDKYLFEKYFEIDQRYSGNISYHENPIFPQNNGGVDIQVFSPFLCDTSNLNNHSIVIVLSYAGHKVILTGDNEPPSWRELLANLNFRNAIANTDIFLASHHGRYSGYYSELFRYFRPRLTIVSDGRFCDTSAVNRYSQVSRGWLVHRRNGGREKRHCVTTRNDGAIVVRVGYTPNLESFIEVTAK